MTAHEKDVGIKSIFEIMELKDVEFPDSVFKKLNQINVSKITEIKEIKGTKLTYLSWADAWTWIKLMFPESSMCVYETPDGSPLFRLNNSGYVKVGVTVDNVEHVEMLPVMIGNSSMTYENITSMDVTRTIQRCATKAIARHGLGMHVYRGEDIPDGDDEKKPAQAQVPIRTTVKTETPKFQTADTIDTKTSNIEYIEYHQKAGGRVSEIIAQMLRQWNVATVRRLPDDKRDKLRLIVSDYLTIQQEEAEAKGGA